MFCIFRDIVLSFLTQLSEFLHGDCKHKRCRLNQSREEVRYLKHFPRNLGGVEHNSERGRFEGLARFGKLIPSGKDALSGYQDATGLTVNISLSPS